MGIDICCYTEVKKGDAWQFFAEDWPISDRHSMLFGFLGHRHYRHNGYPRIAAPRGIPQDLSPEMQAATVLEEDDELLFASWATLRELLDFDYEQVVSRRRVIIEHKPGWDEPFYLRPENDNEGEWKDFTLREEIGSYFLDLLIQVEQQLGNPDHVRFIYWFDQQWSSGQWNRIRSDEFQSDEELLELNAFWQPQLALFHKARADASPELAKIREEFRQIDRRRDERLSVLLGFDAEE